MPSHCRTPRPTPLRTALLGICLLSMTLSVQAEETPDNTRWVSDNLSSYVRSGPTDGYRIVGTLNSGQQVQLLATQGNYSQVRSANGNAVWIPSSDLQSVPGHAERVPQLEQQVAQLSEELADINGTWEARVQGMQETLDARKTLIDELQAARSAVDAELTSAHSQLREAQAQLGAEQQEVLMRYMVYGGGIAGAGLLLGLVLPPLLRSGKKRNDGWV
ncbi:MAG: SH3 domain-containing protein [Gammaproteobacteria bacterium]|nr:SH3 domain-containing protein [Gammaproteobacteria bacterium]